MLMVMPRRAKVGEPMTMILTWVTLYLRNPQPLKARMSPIERCLTLRSTFNLSIILDYCRQQLLNLC
jgi:hypothetical protein